MADDILDRLHDPHSDLSGDAYWTAIYRERKDAADEIERLRADAESMRAIWRTHKCSARTGSSVGQCIDEYGCNCSCGLFIPREVPANG